MPRKRLATETYCNARRCIHYMSRDEAAIRDGQKSLQKKSDLSLSVREEWVQKMQVAKGAKGKTLSATTKRQVLKEVKLGLTMLPAGDVSEERAGQLLPPTGPVWREARGIFWRGQALDHRRVSRACLASGARTACMQHLHILWAHWLERHLLSPTDCPVVGLFEEGEQQAARSSSGPGR